MVDFASYEDQEDFGAKDLCPETGDEKMVHGLALAESNDEQEDDSDDGTRDREGHEDDEEEEEEEVQRSRAEPWFSTVDISPLELNLTQIRKNKLRATRDLLPRNTPWHVKEELIERSTSGTRRPNLARVQGNGGRVLLALQDRRPESCHAVRLPLPVWNAPLSLHIYVTFPTQNEHGNIDQGEDHDRQGAPQKTAPDGDQLYDNQHAEAAAISGVLTERVQACSGFLVSHCIDTLSLALC
jgi:hypothetical protein